VLPLAVTLAGPGRPLAPSAAAVAAVMLLAWAVGVAAQDISWVDVAWGPALALVALVAALTGDGDPLRRWLLAGATALWGLRLGAHILARKLSQPGEDRRYARMRAAHPQRFALWSLRSVFALQGLLVLVVSLPIQVAADRPAAPASLYAPGLALYALGLSFEAIGDEQLRRFRSDQANDKAVLDRGLWAWTRHPNYFGDACVWWGLWLVALMAGGTWWTAVAPLTMTILLVRVSGKALLERDIESRRPGYAEYVRSTSSFWPRPPRRPARAGTATARRAGETRSRGASR